MEKNSEETMQDLYDLKEGKKLRKEEKEDELN